MLRAVRFDTSPPHRPPNAALVVAATAVSVVVSLLADWLLAKLAVAVYPADRGYPHFQFGDYSKLTVIGIVGACIGWPIIVRFCAAPRWLYLRLAVLVTAVLLLPDLWIWHQGQPGRDVIFLVAMHLAIGVITYLAVVNIAPPRAGASRAGTPR